MGFGPFLLISSNTAKGPIFSLLVHSGFPVSKEYKVKSGAFPQLEIEKRPHRSELLLSAHGSIAPKRSNILLNEDPAIPIPIKGLCYFPPISARTIDLEVPCRTSLAMPPRPSSREDNTHR
jgi:hypothetical protein